MGVLRERVEVRGHFAEFGKWLYEYTSTVSQRLFRIKGGNYHVSRYLLGSSRDSYLELKLLFRGPIRLPREKRDSWLLQIEIREFERGVSTEVILSCDVGYEVLDYYKALVKAIQKHWPEAKVRMLPEESSPSASKEPSTRVTELVSPFDHAKVYAHLCALRDDGVISLDDLECESCVEVERDEHAPTHVRYRLSHPQLGHLGIIELVQLKDDEATAIIIYDSTKPHVRQFINEARESLNTIPFGEEYINQANVKIANIESERKMLHRQRRAYLEDVVVQQLRTRVAGDPILRGLLGSPSVTQNDESDASEKSKRPRQMRKTTRRRADFFKQLHDETQSQSSSITMAEFANLATQRARAAIRERLEKENPSWRDVTLKNTINNHMRDLYDAPDGFTKDMVDNTWDSLVKLGEVKKWSEYQTKQ